jgi:ABC-type sugar transport system ATPase subunit
MADTILRMTGIEKRFGPVKALDNVDFELQAGEIHALLGVNGAGKSTLVKILSGVYLKDAGSIEIRGKTVEFAGPRDAIDNGVAAVQQHPELVPGLSGHENIYLGRERRAPGLFGRFDRKALHERADALLSRFPIEIDLGQDVGTMPAVDREVIAILHALTRDDIAVLILDEPTSTLTEREKAMLFRLMRALKESGIAIVYITHRLEEVFEIADRFTIFRGGRRVGTMTSDDARAQGVSIPDMMLGEKTGELFPDRDGAAGETMIETRDLSQDGAFEGVSLTARRGEILGIFGLVGSGMDELSKALFGVTKPQRGTIHIEGRPVALRGPDDALRRKIFLVPGDRRTEGLTLTRDVTFNMTLANLGRAALGGFMKLGAERRNGADLARQVALTPPHLQRTAGQFSGGNQQKIVIAKGLYAEAEIYIFVEPTVGVDIGARATLYSLMRELSKTKSVIVMSSDCDEVFGLADHVMALYKGRVALSAPSASTTRDQLLAAGIMSEAQRNELRQSREGERLKA